MTTTTTTTHTIRSWNAEARAHVDDENMRFIITSLREHSRMEGHKANECGGMEFWLEKRNDIELGDGLGSFHSFVIRGAEWDEDYSLGTVGRFSDDKYWEAVAMDVVRDDVNPLLAAAQLILATV